MVGKLTLYGASGEGESGVPEEEPPQAPSKSRLVIYKYGGSSRLKFIRG